MNLEWRPLKKLYTKGECLYVNGILVGGWSYEVLFPTATPYKVITTLPSYRLHVDTFTTIEEAKDMLEKFTKKWIRRISN